MLVLFGNVTFVSLFPAKLDDKFRENNILTCPAGYSYYSTNDNDGVEDYFNQTDNGEF